MNPLINLQHNPFAEVPAQIQEEETYSYSKSGLLTFSFVLGGVFFALGYLFLNWHDIKIVEEVFLILWLFGIGIGLANWPKALRCDLEGITVYYWFRPAKNLQYSKISVLDVRYTRRAMTIYKGKRKQFCTFLITAICDSEKLVKTIAERANLPLQKWDAQTGNALFSR